MIDRPPSRLLRLFFKAPIVLYRLRMGWLLSSRNRRPFGLPVPRRTEHGKPVVSVD